MDDDASAEPTEDLIHDPRLIGSGLLYEAHAGLRSAFEPDLERCGMPGSTFEVLMRLARADGRRLRMTELARRSTLSNSGLTRVVDRLLAAGLVEREQDAEDRRVFHAVLTERGLARVLETLPCHLDTIDRTIGTALEPHEVDELVRLLMKLRAVVNPGAANGSDPTATVSPEPAR